jgi:hypothetical protein
MRRENAMSEAERRDALSERVAESVRHALALVGPAESGTEHVDAEEDQLVS